MLIDTKQKKIYDIKRLITKWEQRCKGVKFLYAIIIKLSVAKGKVESSQICGN